MLCLKLSLISSKTLSLFMGLVVRSCFKSAFIFSMTSNATLFSSKVSSSSQNKSSNCFSLITLVVTFSFITWKRPFFSSLISIFCSSLSSVISCFSFFTSVSSSFFFFKKSKNPCFSSFLISSSLGSSLSSTIFSFIFSSVSSSISFSSFLLSFLCSFFSPSLISDF